jgi:branched-chain amino acid transport system permease protein
MESVEIIGYLALTYVILALGLNVALGYAGTFSVGHGAFYACGAYVSGISSLLLNRHLAATGVPLIPHYLLCVVAGVTVTTVLGGIVGLLTIRLKSDYFLLATFAFGEIVHDVLLSSSWSGGSLGLRSIPPPLWHHQQLAFSVVLTVLAMIAAVMFWACGRIERSLFGLALFTVAYDEILSLTLGENPTSLKIRALMISAGICAVAGALIVPLYGYIDPSFFGVQESVLVLSMVLLGGIGSRIGALTGALLLVGIPALLPHLSVPVPWREHLQQIIYGTVLVLIMRFRPFGIFGKRMLR